MNSHCRIHHSLVPSSGTIAQRQLCTVPLLYSAALAVKYCFVSWAENTQPSWFETTCIAFMYIYLKFHLSTELIALFVRPKPPTKYLANVLPFACLFKVNSASKLLGAQEKWDPMYIVVEHPGIWDIFRAEPLGYHRFSPKRGESSSLSLAYE